MKKYTSFIAELLLAPFLTGSLAVAGSLRTFVAEEADFPILVNGEMVQLDMPVVTIQDRTYPTAARYGRRAGDRS